jgi:SAM-dependent MidA family methyltransferase
VPDGAGAGPSPLVDRIRDEIDRSGPITFARFMDLALHDPTHGYYARGPERLGTLGDFFTASDVGRAFGRTVGRQLIEIDRLLGSPDPFDVIEYGAGRGLLARDVLDALAELSPDLRARARYVMVDRSAAMRDGARRRVPEATAVTPAEIRGGGCGCVLAVELFDALPVHRVRRREGRLVEIAVTVGDDGALAECETEPCAEAAAWARTYGAAADDGSEAEVAPASEVAMTALARPLDAGVWIVVDYGDRAEGLYTRDRARGTLLAYHAHATNEAFLERVGEQDLTAHVNFTALEDAARRAGLEVLGLTTQDRFLVANGILEAFEQPDTSAVYDPRRVKERMQAMQLIHPMGMGRTFKVLMLAKECPGASTLRGLEDPFARGPSGPKSVPGVGG